MTQHSEAEASQNFGELVNLPMSHFYVNGFTNSMSATEITTVIQFGPRPLAVLSMSPSLAKSYAKALNELIDRFEKDTDSQVLLVEELISKMAR